MKKILSQFKVLFWDFDGVLMDSMKVREIGFRNVLKDYPDEAVDELVKYHMQNGGLSRYLKFRYFYESVLQEKVEEKQIIYLANQFKKIMLSLLIDEKLLIKSTNIYVKENYKKQKMHITSGSDEEELHQICSGVGIHKYFKNIKGSPTTKIENVNNLIIENDYRNKDCILIGDSINDLDAAVANNIKFAGFNNLYLKGFLQNDQIFYLE